MDGVAGVDPAPGGGVDDRLEGGAQVPPQAERKPPVTFRYPTIGRRSRLLPLLIFYQSVEESRLQPGGSGSKLTTSIATSVPVVTTRMTSAALSADARTSRCADARARNSRGVPAPTSRRMTSPRL